MLPKIMSLNNHKLIQSALQLDPVGKVEVSANNFTYLKIDDQYIHKLFPLLQNKKIKKPDYFGAGLAGAHVSIIYPEENKSIAREDLEKQHHFEVKELVAATLGVKTYYALLVESASLLQLRKKHQLSDMLCLKGYSIGFHITIGVSLNRY